MPPEKHALLSASSASRWLKCTAAPRFEEGLPENTSSMRRRAAWPTPLVNSRSSKMHPHEHPDLQHPAQ